MAGYRGGRCCESREPDNGQDTVQLAASLAGVPKHMPYMTEVRRQDSGKLRCAAMLSPRVIYIATKVECMNQRASIG